MPASRKAVRYTEEACGRQICVLEFIFCCAKCALGACNAHFTRSVAGCQWHWTLCQPPRFGAISWLTSTAGPGLRVHRCSRVGACMNVSCIVLPINYWWRFRHYHHWLCWYVATVVEDSSMICGKNSVIYGEQDKVVCCESFLMAW